jgi:RNase P subunit RPR2
MDYICKKCNNDKFYAKTKLMSNGNSYIGLYCNNCNIWHKWISKIEFQKLKESRISK